MLLFERPGCFDSRWGFKCLRHHAIALGDLLKSRFGIGLYIAVDGTIETDVIKNCPVVPDGSTARMRYGDADTGLVEGW